MRKASLMLLALLPVLLLSGCSASRQVEHQAYVIAMGVDSLPDGRIELSVQIPRISGGQESSGGSSGSSGSYMPLSVSAADYAHAFERLSWAVPRDMNLSQLELLVLSEELAGSEACPQVLDQLVNTQHIYTAASVIVCEGSAKEFVLALKPTLGTRLSADIQASIDHYRGMGILPACSLAELWYRMNSPYSDPIAGFALLDKQDGKTQDDAKQASSGIGGNPEKTSPSSESDLETRYIGAAVFSDGVCRGTLDGYEAVLTSLLRGSLDSFRCICGGESLEFTPIGRPAIDVDTQAQPPKIRIKLRLSVQNQVYLPDETVMHNTLEEDIRAVIAAAQAMGTDPFGFADTAAGSFSTLQAWEDYDWDQHYPDAQIEIKLRFSGAGS